jgi:hypothetical protein
VVLVARTARADSISPRQTNSGRLTQLSRDGNADHDEDEQHQQLLHGVPPDDL